MRSLYVCLAATFWIVLCVTDPGLAGVDCAADLYRNAVFTEPQTDFSPYDKIFIVVECDGLTVGPQVMHANWIHEKRGLIRSNTYDFFQEADGKRSIYFWFKLLRRGPLASTLLNKDFHEENFGRWLVEVYLNDEPLLSREFSITP